LVALDLRGHGHSDKPLDGYADSRLWADDLSALIRELRLEQPVVCGWSYGPLVILDYIRHYGDDSLGGISFVGGITRLGSHEAMAVLSPDIRGLVPGLFATDAQESVRSLEALVGLFFARPTCADDRYLMLGYNAAVPPFVRQALFSRAFDNDDVLARIRKPVLLMHGAQDAVVDPSVVDQHKAALPHAQVRVLPNTGHAAFWDDAPGFNRDLRAFCQNL
jgi:pimeloyl-ACP methyl ester carboxylesterase